jgi:hypothetical protein
VKRRDLKIYLFLIVFGVLVLGGMAASAFYSEEIGVFVRGGWNRGGIGRVATDFVTDVRKMEYETAVQQLQPGGFELLREDGQIVGIEKVEASYRSKYLFDAMYPSEEPKVKAVEWTNADGGAFVVSLAFPSGKESRFLVRKVDGAFKITQFLSR